MQKIKPTRIELIKLKRKLKTSLRGHKLLKEKRDGLMKKFMEIIKEAKSKRKEMEEKLSDASRNFAIISSPLMQKEVEQFFLIPTVEAEVSFKEENIMGVKTPRFSFEIKEKEQGYSYISFPMGMEESVNKYKDASRVMLELANIEHTARLLSFEIEKTRRRVNALEYIIIPEIRRNIKYISAKLDENERFEKITRIKIKAMIS
ncbi:MAG: hypothetical protein A2365_03025 [Candidatus Nealsonbacteria bacterium RIFOXYB1_FULL_40_15]|uniref:V-type ATP synthase subunit D n=2 Tax=Candidatus Nealsoniibacteriota TaxID=1817911 RepID=A0A1G2EV17_9BACT|nr:MAG: hypothetical protein A2365_03025 [Candidatus Nealsonbacteria bacterium RIFOXYB1_FULL_40_15]OGZ29201.1 MAG: hypothetical protein A2427_02880 [Candidatus Nealsonbacteria bacterium RIFOXYC1_FULL_40_7]OGZ29882.1 MAG: hypothetical protein A2562_02060 [Candidatus Nealsonbacteria bacterium RIFOXYD1_FULL_39_11]